MPIRAFHLEQFKSYEAATLRLFPLTLLIGPNASGKSNLVEALRLLSRLAGGTTLDEYLVPPFEGTPEVRGFLHDFPKDRGARFALACSLDPAEHSRWSQFRVVVSADEMRFRVAEEAITSPSGEPLYSLTDQVPSEEHRVEVTYNTLGQGPDDGRLACSNRRLILTQLDSPAAFHRAHDEAQRELPSVTASFRRALQSVRFVQPNPALIREARYVERGPKLLDESASNLSGVLEDLCRRQQRAQEVLAFVRDLPEEEIRDVRFLETPRDEVMLSVIESFGRGERQWEPDLLSDGTLRALSVAAAALSSPEGSVVVIEEIDAGIHPSRARALLENIQKVARQRSLRVLLTSHNPALLDALPLEAIPHVACCFRDPDDGSSRLVHLEDVCRYPELVAQGTVGRLMTNGVLDRYLKDKRTEEQRRRDALAWLQRWREGQP